MVSSLSLSKGQLNRFRKVSKRALSFELSAIKQIELAASKDSEIISLAQGIPFLPTPQPIKDFVEDQMLLGKCDQYSLTPGIIELREELSKSLLQEGTSYDPEDELIVTAGSIEGMTATLLTFIEQGDEVLVPTPTYTSYLGSIQLAGGVPKFFKLDEDNGYDFSPEDFEKCITSKTRAIIFCTPNNPTGTIYSRTQTEKILQIAEKHDLLVIIDEAYKDYYFSGEKHFSPSNLPWARERVIRVCSFSKAYAMTGWRVGFVAAPRELCSNILRVHDLLVTCAPVASQYAALAALQIGEESLREYIQIFQKHRDIAVQYLDRMSEWLDFQVPQATYFAFPRLKDSVKNADNSALFVSEVMKEAKVAFVYGSAFGPGGESHIRINFGRSEEDLTKGLDRLANYLGDKGSKSHALVSPPHSTRSSSGTSNSGTANSGTADSSDAYSASHTASHTASHSSARRSSISTRSSFQESVLAFLAKQSLKNSDTTIIGIIGVRGKTVTKRIIHRLLQHDGETSSSILSYNSIKGVCLSILGLSSPRDLFTKISFLFKAITKAFFKKRKTKYLLLEFGVTHQSEIEKYLTLAKPTILLVTGSFGYEDKKNSSQEETSNLFGHFIDYADPSLLLLPSDEPWLSKKTLITGQSDHSVQVIDIDNGTPASSHPLLKSLHLPSRSEKLAYSYALALAKHLKLSDKQIESFLHEHRKS